MLQVKEAVPQAKQAEKAVTSAPSAAKQADSKVKEAVPQAKQAEKAVTSAPEKAKKADSQVKQAVPQAKQLEKAITPVRCLSLAALVVRGPSLAWCGILGVGMLAD